MIKDGIKLLPPEDPNTCKLLMKECRVIYIIIISQYAWACKIANG